jgi:hypothetical protein
VGCEDGRWMELAQHRVQWRALVLAVLNLRVLLRESWLISKMDLRETGCEDGTGSGSCPVAGFGTSGVEPSGYGTGVRSRGKWEWSV